MCLKNLKQKMYLKNYIVNYSENEKQEITF